MKSYDVAVIERLMDINLHCHLCVNKTTIRERKREGGERARARERERGRERERESETLSR